MLELNVNELNDVVGGLNLEDTSSYYDGGSNSNYLDNMFRDEQKTREDATSGRP